MIGGDMMEHGTIGVGTADAEARWVDSLFGPGAFFLSNRSGAAFHPQSGRWFDHVVFTDVIGQQHSVWFDVTSVPGPRDRGTHPTPFVVGRPAGQAAPAGFSTPTKVVLGAFVLGVLYFAYSSSKSAEEESSKRLSETRRRYSQPGAARAYAN